MTSLRELHLDDLVNELLLVLMVASTLVSEAADAMGEGAGICTGQDFKLTSTHGYLSKPFVASNLELLIGRSSDFTVSGAVDIL